MSKQSPEVQMALYASLPLMAPRLAVSRHTVRWDVEA